MQSYLPYLLQRADQLVSRQFHQELQNEGIAISEWRVLAVLHEVGEASISTLAELTMLPQPTVTHAVARLEADTHVLRRAGTTDRRQRFVVATPAGTALAERLMATATDRTADVLAGVDATTVARLQRDVVALIDGMATGRRVSG